MKLSELLAYDNIVIQCHNNPDADTIACGFGVYLYLKSKGKEPRLIYGGQNVIRKTNLVMLIRDLKIPIEHVDYLHKPELLVMVDCQYHSGNSAVFEAEHIAVIDHTGSARNYQSFPRCVLIWARARHWSGICSKQKDLMYGVIVSCQQHCIMDYIRILEV